MSKKIVKRSLVLGALMAMVITGSAMAADITTQLEADNVGNVVEGQVFTVEDSITVDKDVLTITNTKGRATSDNPDDYDLAAISSAVYHNGTNANITVLADKLEITSDGLYGIASGGIHDLLDAESVVNLGTEDNKNGSVKISTPNGYGITTNGRGGTVSKVNIFADELTIESGLGAIRAWRSDDGISLGSEKTPIDKINLVGKNSETVRAFAGPVEIYGNDVTLDNKGVGKVIVATNTNVDVVANDKLKITGDIEAVSFQTTVGSDDVMININKDNSAAKVEIDGNIKTTANGGAGISGVNINLGAEGSYLNGSIQDENQKVTLTMNEGNTWNVTADSTLNTLTGVGGTIAIDKDAKVTMTNADSSTFGVVFGVDGTDLQDTSTLYSTANTDVGSRIKIENDTAAVANSYSVVGANAENMAIRGDVTVGFDDAGNITSTKTTLNTDELVVAGDVKADNGKVSLKETAAALETKADKATTLSGYGITDAYTKTEVDDKIADNSAAISGLNQRLGSLNGKIKKVGAGAAALAALHPLDYDPDDKLTFSAGMGNYAGENAAAIGAFYRPDEKLMFSLGGTMGNGENMVNLGVSIGLDKPNGLAKMSKRELIQKVSTMEAENDAMAARIEKLESLVAQLAAK